MEHLNPKPTLPMSVRCAAVFEIGSREQVLLGHASGTHLQAVPLNSQMLSFYGEMCQNYPHC
jgi:hypothetical protein